MGEDCLYELSYLTGAISALQLCFNFQLHDQDYVYNGFLTSSPVWKIHFCLTSRCQNSYPLCISEGIAHCNCKPSEKSK